MHIDEKRVNNQTFAMYLKEAGYTVGMFGKYLTNGGGHYFGPQFDTQGVSDLAPYFMEDGGWTGTDDLYTTSVVGNISLSWKKGGSWFEPLLRLHRAKGGSRALHARQMV